MNRAIFSVASLKEDYTIYTTDDVIVEGKKADIVLVVKKGSENDIKIFLEYLLFATNPDKYTLVRGRTLQLTRESQHKCTVISPEDVVIDEYVPEDYRGHDVMIIADSNGKFFWEFGYDDTYDVQPIFELIGEMKEVQATKYALEKIEAEIGYSITVINSSETSHPFMEAHTHGITKKFNLPELVFVADSRLISGLGAVLNNIVDNYSGGVVWPDRITLKNGSQFLKIAIVDPSTIKDLYKWIDFNSLLDIEDYRVIVTPDPRGSFPWEPGYDSEFEKEWTPAYELLDSADSIIQ